MYRRVVSIDAFNTLFTPKKPIIELYTEVSRKHGINTNKHELSRRFIPVFHKFEQQYPNYGKLQGLTHLEWWSMLIRELYAPVCVSEEFSQELIDLFKGEGYSSFSDIQAYLAKHQHDTVFVVSSNGDPRIRDALAHLNLAQYFKQVYLSYDMEVVKPDVRFFNHIYNDISSKYAISGRANYWHVGDEIKNDLNGSYDAGWNGVLIDRSGESQINNLNATSLTNMKLNASKETASNNNNGKRNYKLQDRKFIISSFEHLDRLMSEE